MSACKSKRIIATLTSLAMIIVFIFALAPARQTRADGVNPGIESFVSSLYSDCLGRNPDPSGLNDWCERLASGSVSGKQCAYGFFFSSEFQSRANSLSDSELINAYYKVFLGRSADPSGSSYWTSEIASTTNDLGVLFTGFADSAEFAQKCTACGITAGEHIDVPTTVRQVATAAATAVAATPVSAPVSTPSTTNNVVPASSSGVMVWIPNTGRRYHSRSSCSGMIDPSYVTIEQAQALGFTPCARCY